MTISAMVRNARQDARAREEIKTTALFTLAWFIGCAAGIAGGLVMFGC